MNNRWKRLARRAGRYLGALALVLIAGQSIAATRAELERKLPGTEGLERLQVLSDLAFGTARSEPDVSLRYSRELLDFATRIGNRSGMAVAHNHMALAYRYLGLYQKALEHALESLRIREGLGEPDGLAVANSNLGIVYWRLGDYPRALEHLERALEIRRSRGETGKLPPAINNLALVYISQGNLEAARKSYQEILDIVEKSGDDANLDRYLGNMAELQLDMGHPRPALDYSRRSLELKRRSGDRSGLAAVLYVVGRAERLLGDVDRSRATLDEALQNAAEFENLNAQKEIHLALAEVEADAHHYRDAYEHHRRYAEIRDRLFSEESTHRVEQLKAGFDIEQKDREISLLKTEQKLRDLEIDRQRGLRNLLVALLAAALALGVMGFLLFRTTSRAKRALSRRNDELSALDQIVRTINREVDLPEVLKRLLEQSLGLVPGAERGGLLLRDPAHESYRLVARVGSGPVPDAAIELTFAEIRHRYIDGGDRLGDGIYRRKDGTPLLDENGPTRELLSVLIEVEGELESVLLLSSSSEAFARLDVRRLSRLREHAVSAIHKSQIVAQARSDRERAEHALDDLQRAHQELERLSRTDPLTGLDNRRGILEHIETERHRAKRSAGTFSVVLGDIDDFKLFNDRYGHDCGDQVLRWVAAELRQAVRGQDQVGRWGGEEFLLLLPDTDLAGATRAAEKIRARLADGVVDYGSEKLAVHMTLGVAEHLQTNDVDATVQAADECLLRGKRTGKNRVVAIAAS